MKTYKSALGKCNPSNYCSPNILAASNKAGQVSFIYAARRSSYSYRKNFEHLLSLTVFFDLVHELMFEKYVIELNRVCEKC